MKYIHNYLEWLYNIIQTIFFRCSVESKCAHIKRIYKRTECNSLEQLRAICPATPTTLFYMLRRNLRCGRIGRSSSLSYLLVGIPVLEYVLCKKWWCGRSCETVEVWWKALYSWYTTSRDFSRSYMQKAGNSLWIRPFVTSPWKDVLPPVPNTK